MSVETLIEEIRKLSPEERDKITAFIAEWEADQIAVIRDREMEDGKVTPLSEEIILHRIQGRLG